MYPHDTTGTGLGRFWHSLLHTELSKRTSTQLPLSPFHNSRACLSHWVARAFSETGPLLAMFELRKYKKAAGSAHMDSISCVALILKFILGTTPPIFRDSENDQVKI